MDIIKFVYFDVGGVALLDFSKTNKWLELQREIGISDDKRERFMKFWKQYEPEVCIGRDLDTLMPLLKSEFGIVLPSQYSLLKNGFVDRFKYNQSIWPVVNLIKKKCKIGLLTNMYPHMLSMCKEKGLLSDTKWDVVVDSTDVNVKKPDEEIYMIAEEKAGLKPQEVLFIDNGEKNLVVAKKRGWNTFLYDSAYPEKSSKKLYDFLKFSFEGIG